VEVATERRTVTMGKLTIQEVAKVLVEKNGLDPKDASHFASEFFALILQQLQQDDQVKIKGLGTFKIINVEARESVSVQTGERVVIDSHSKVTFTPDTVMKELVNKPFSQFETVVLNDGVEFADLKDEKDAAVEEKEETVEEQQPVVAPIIEDEPAAVAEEPVVAPVIEDEPAAVIEEPAAVIEEPAAAPAVEEEPAAAPVIAEPAAAPVAEEVVAEREQPVTTMTFDDGEDNEHPWWRWILTILGIVALMLLAAYGGYEFGRRQAVAVPDTIVVKDTVYMAEMADSALLTGEEVEQPVAVQPETVQEAPQPVKEQAQPAKEQAKPAAENFDKYAAMDERVRLGAYRIVGTLREVTVEPGQTFYSICRAHLGPDMQCYVEVYNGLPKNPTIKVGQVIKIPKLESKKRRRRQND
jgi:nucleoid DNA-binding protein